MTEHIPMPAPSLCPAPPGPDAARGRPTAAWRALAGRAALVTALLASLAVLYTRIAQTISVNSDHAGILLEADSFLRGNPLLRGWTLTNVSFYTLDLPFYVLAVKVCGLRPGLMRAVPAVVYALTVLAAVWLAGRGPERRQASMGRAVTFLLIGLPSLLVPEIVLVGVNHVATTLWMLAALLALDGGKSGRDLFLFGLLCTLTLVGDQMAAFVLVLPALLVAAARGLRGGREAMRREGPMTATLLLSVLLAHITLTVIRACGGFVTMPLSVVFVSLDKLPQNLLVTVQSLLEIFRADFFGERLEAATVGRLVGLLGLGAVLYGLFQTRAAWRDGGDRVSQILGVAMGINLLAFALDSSVSSMPNTLYSPPERYLVPFFVFGSVLAGRLGVERAARHPQWPLMQAALASVGVVYLALFAVQLRQPPADLPAAHLARWLADHGLHDGFGNFWCSSLVTAESGGAVRVRPVEADSGRVRPLHWSSRAQWYTGAYANFVVYDVAQCDRGNFYWGSVNARTAQDTFGPPAQVAQVGPYTVLVWPKTITPEAP